MSYFYKRTSPLFPFANKQRKGHAAFYFDRGGWSLTNSFEDPIEL